MHISLHQAFKGYLSALGQPGLYEDSLAKAGLTVEQFETEDYHDDAEMQNAMAAAAGILDKLTFEFLTEWGIGISQSLLDSYESAIDVEWKLLDLLEHIESRMHTHSREEFGARPPVLVTDRLGENQLRIDVETDKGMTGLAHGFVHGFAQSLNETVDVAIEERPDSFTFLITTS